MRMLKPAVETGPRMVGRIDDGHESVVKSLLQPNSV